MKRLFALCLVLCLALCLVLFPPLSASAEKAYAFPDCFLVTYTVSERKTNNGQSFVSKEYVHTTRPEVDKEINGLVDAFDAQFSPGLQRTASPKRNSRLDIHVVNTRSGDSCLSFLVLARESYNRKQLRSPFACRVFDMASGEQVALVDILGEESEAWDVLAEIAYCELDGYFADREANYAALNGLCRKETLMKTPFLLGPVCLTLVYEAKTLYPGETSLMYVTVPYNALRGMMTAYGERQTDNSRYKMVALTFDDGPVYENTAKVLNELRRNGVQATFFMIGTQIEENPDIALRAHDELHSLQSHHYRHASKSSADHIQEDTRRMEALASATWGLGPWLFRAPYDRFDRFIEAGVDLPMIAYDVDAGDGSGRQPNEVLYTVKKQVHDGAVIRMHDTVDNAAESCRFVTEWLYENGYMCVTVEELFIHYKQEMVSGEVFCNVTPTY
jgi:peptidoglycan/xylan/chitin deacetylase (PgdA/CDA1 family)